MSDDARARELRKLFPATEHWTYLYNGSIHPCAVPVRRAMEDFLGQWSRGGEAAFFPAFEKFGQLREAFASLIHADARNIVITESTTAAINLAAQILRPKPRQNVVVTDLEFMTNTYPWLVSQAPMEVRFVESRDGRIEPERIAEKVDADTAAVHLCAVTVGSGFRHDLSAVRAAIHEVPLIIDGAQALGVVGVDVHDPPIDFLACTASKWLMGPAGVGFLCVADRHLNATPPGAGWLSAANAGDWDVRRCVLHDDARRFQGGIPNLIGVVGALAGLELLEEIGREFVERRVRALTGYLIDELAKLGVELWTPRDDSERAGIVFFRAPRIAELHTTLKAARFYCGSFQGGIRVDPNFYNTFEELDRFVGVVREHLKPS
jgi:selenocysteine lyase/cysteine desulfurase